MSQASLRMATPQDLDAVSQLLQASYPALLASAYPAALLDQILPAMTVAQPALLASGRAFVVTTRARVLAFGGWSADEPGTGTTEPGLGHLRHFAVHPEAVRQGLGRWIARSCGAQATAMGLRHWRVFASLNAVPFYRSLGLAALGRADVPIGPAMLETCLMEGPIAADTHTKTPG